MAIGPDAAAAGADFASSEATCDSVGLLVTSGPPSPVGSDVPLAVIELGGLGNAGTAEAIGLMGFGFEGFGGGAAVAPVSDDGRAWVRSSLPLAGGGATCVV